jgi:hypothetical protein
VSVTTVDGQTFSFGDYTDHVCVQAVSKTITYCMAAEENGLDKVHKYGYFPSHNLPRCASGRPIAWPIACDTRVPLMPPTRADMLAVSQVG